MPWFPILLVIHITLAVSLLLPSLLLPFLLRRDSGPDTEVSTAVRLLGTIQGIGSLVISLGLAATGIGLLVVLGPDLLRKPWLIAALAIYSGNLLVAGLVSRPNLRRLLGGPTSGPADAAAWNRRARRQRLLAYAMAAATGLIGFLMSAKPEL